MRTIREFKTQVQALAGVKSTGQFCGLSEAHRTFWKVLNTLGWRLRTQEPEQTTDVDATAFLSDTEWRELETEFWALGR
ncbi:TPA: hypothetical protein DF272_05485 [Candidatus Falkowbacteria bacterium]|nr:hypothetical protein [Candidatus Falkowbacteria bacterium]